MLTIDQTSKAKKVLEVLRDNDLTISDLICAIELSSENPGVAEEPKAALEERLPELLHMIGIPAHIKGYRYVRYAIVFAKNNPEAIESVTKALYPAVAKEYGTTPSRVERAIRHAIEVAWDRGDPQIFEKTFGFSIDPKRGKPTNSEFIAMMVECL